MSIDELRAFQRYYMDKEKGEFFLGLPDHWLDDPHYRCAQGHISSRILRSENRGDLCLACQQVVVMTFPEDVEVFSEV